MIWQNEYSTTWRTRFAWLPVSLFDGRTVWLQRFQERYVPQTGCEWDIHGSGIWQRKLMFEPDQT